LGREASNIAFEQVLEEIEEEEVRSKLEKKPTLEHDLADLED